MFSSDSINLLTEAYYSQVYEGAFGSASKPAASADAARAAADKHRRAAETATSADARRRHRNAAAGYEVTARRMMADNYEFLLGYLIDENFASDENSAHSIIENMSDEWIESIFEQNLNEVSGMGRVIMRSIADAARRGMKVTPGRKIELKKSQVERSIPKLQTDGTAKELGKAEERFRRLDKVDKSRSMVRNKPDWWGAKPPQRGYGSR